MPSETPKPYRVSVHALRYPRRVPEEPPLSIHVLLEIEDRLFPVLELNVWERALYYHLLRHVVAAETMSVLIGLASAARATAMSEDRIRRAIRDMAAKGCVRIEDRGRRGHQVRLLLPHEIEQVRAASSEIATPTIDEIDFYEDRRYRPAILRRDEDACFYCARLVTVENVVLDHVIAEAEGGDNSHRNIVAACHECNSLKQAMPATDFMRLLYRKGVLSQDDLAARLDRLGRLRAGTLPLGLDTSD